MPTPKRPQIVGLEWDAENEAHIEEHVAARLVEEMIERGDWFAFPNSRGHPQGRLLVVGRVASGDFLTAVLKEPSPFSPGIWRPITAWRSEPRERQRYNAERRRWRQDRG